MTPLTAASVGSALVAGGNRARKKVKIRVKTRFRFDRRTAQPGEILEVYDSFAIEMIAERRAEYVVEPEPPPPPREATRETGASTRFEAGTKQPPRAKPKEG